MKRKSNCKGQRSVCICRQIICVLLLFTMVLVLSACEKGKVNFKDDQMMKVGDTFVSRKSAFVLLCALQTKYQTMFGDDAWQKKFGDGTLDQYMKEQVKTQLVQVISLNLMAEEKKIVLNDREKKRAKQAAAEFAGKLTQKQLKQAGFEKKDIEELYMQYALADKVYHEVTDAVNPEISDDQARMIDVQVILLKTVYKDESGQEQSLNPQEVDTVTTRAYQVWSRANSGESFETLAAEFNEAEKLEYHIGRGEMEAAFDDVAFNLANGQMSSLVQLKDGICIIKCISNYNQAETDANKQMLYAEECANLFNKSYDAFMKNVQVKVNDKAWDLIQIDSGSKLPEIDFVQIYEKVQ